MKKLYAVLVLLFLFNLVFAQSEKIRAIDEGKSSYKIDPHKFLSETEETVTKFFKENPGYLKEKSLKKIEGFNFKVGDTKEWYARDMVASKFYLVSSTCRAVGTNCYIFVEDALWGNRVTQAGVDGVLNAFDNSTPANPNKGIYQTNVETFGDPPNVDGDSKIIILMLDIKDGYNGTGGYVAGYFHGWNQLPKSQYSGSNEAEIYYLDANPGNLSTQSGIDNAMATAAHEFQHMIHFNYHSSSPSQGTFYNEGCSTVAEVVCGYPIYTQSYYNASTNVKFDSWDNDNSLPDYSRAARFMVYMYDQYGKEFLKKFVQSTYVNVGGINDALSKLSNSTGDRFPQVIENWLTANVVNDRSVNSKYGYITSGIDRVAGIPKLNPEFTVNGKVESGAMEVYRYSDVKDVKVTVSSGDSYIKFKAVKIKENSITVDELNKNTEYTFDKFGVDYEVLYVTALNVDAYSSGNYNIVSGGSAGVIELKYDINKISGVLGLDPGDSVSVIFDGVQGAMLDSIKVALRQAGSVYGGLFKYTGTTRPSPLGEKLKELTVTSNITTKPPYPYPDPWTNWVTVDLTSDNISANDPFVVAFVIEGDYPDYNRVMVTSQLADNIHSFTYLNNPSSGTPGWYYLTDSQVEGNAFAYIIRAYVSMPTAVDDEETIELLPGKYNLSQNYPNPFNPSTTISFYLPKREIVTLKIYDTLGKEVAVLVNEEKSAGSYNVNFDARNLSSGVYFYRLEAGEFKQTKKLTILK